MPNIIKSNPFADFMNQGGMGQQTPQPGPMMQQKNAAIGAAQGPMNQISQLEPGQDPGVTSHLLRASQGLQNYIKASSDPEEIRMARMIVAMIARLIERDQGKMSQDLGDEPGEQEEVPGMPEQQESNMGALDISRVAQMLGQN